MANEPANQRLNNAVAEKAKPSLVTVFEDGLKKWWQSNGKKMVSLCGSEEIARKLLVTAINVVTKTPKLAECNFGTFANCLLQSAELNLFPGALQEAAYVPMSIKGKMECNFWPMYPGLVKLAYNSGFVKSISCEMVYEGDEFDFQFGTDQFLKHRPFIGNAKERGERMLAYCVVKTTTGDSIIKIMSMAQIWAIKERAPGGKSSESPWNASDESFDAMCRKTVLKQALKLIPKSENLARAIELDPRDDNSELSRDKIIDSGKLISGLIPHTSSTDASAEDPRQGATHEA